MKKRILSLLLCVVLCLSLMPAAVFAADITSGSGWRLDGDGCLHLTGAVKYTENNVPWGNYKKQIKTVVAETGSSISNGYALFSDCTELTSADLRALNTAGVTSIRAMFSGCKKLTALDLSGFDTSGAVSMIGVFSGCSSLTSLDISSFRVTGSPNVSSFFSGCTALAELKVSADILGKTASQLIALSGKWMNGENNTVFASAADLQAITGPVTLVKMWRVTFVTTNGVTVSYGGKNYADGESAEIPAGKQVYLYAQKIPSGMRLNDMTADDGTVMGNGGTICRIFIMPAHDLTVTVTLSVDTELKGTLRVSGEFYPGSTLTATLSDANSTELLFRWLDGKTLLGTGKTFTVPDDFMGQITCEATASDKDGTKRTTVTISSRTKHTLTFVIPYGATVEYGGTGYANGESTEVNVGKQVNLYALNMPKGTSLESMKLSDGSYADNGGTICRFFMMPDYDVTVTVILSGTPERQPGDVNGDGSVDSKDVLLLKRRAADLVKLTAEQEAASDVNHDGSIDSKDVLMLKRAAAGLITLK